jgi:type IV secretion system protein VirB3
MRRADDFLSAVRIVIDPLYLAVTRPAMAFGVTYAALLVNAVVTVELFLVTQNLLCLLVSVPIHGIFMLLCMSEPRFFDLLLLWGRTRGAAISRNLRLMGASTYSPLVLDLPSRSSRREPRWPALPAFPRPPER